MNSPFYVSIGHFIFGGIVIGMFAVLVVWMIWVIVLLGKSIVEMLDSMFH